MNTYRSVYTISRSYIYRGIPQKTNLKIDIMIMGEDIWKNDKFALRLIYHKNIYNNFKSLVFVVSEIMKQTDKK